MTFSRESKGGSSRRPGYDCSLLVTLLFPARKKERKKGEKEKSIIYFAQTKQRADIVDSERDGWIDEIANPGQHRQWQRYFFDISLLSSPFPTTSAIYYKNVILE